MNEFRKNSVVRFKGFVGVVLSMRDDRCYVVFKGMGWDIVQSSLEIVNEVDLSRDEALIVAEIRRRMR